MKGMFKGCTCLNILDLSLFNTENVIDMSEMFCDCNNLKFLNLSNFNTENVKSMYRMFYGCFFLFFLNISKFQTNNVTNMKEMFYQCSSLKSLDLSNFDTSNVENMENMFNNCLYFTNLKNDFISKISEQEMKTTIEKTSKTFLEKESGMISKTIQYCNQNLINYKDTYKDLINQSIKDFVNNIKYINVILLGQSGVGKSTLVNALKSKNSEEKSEDLSEDNNKIINVDEADFLRLWDIKGIDNNNSEEVLSTAEAIITSSKNKDLESSIHFIWFCITGTLLDPHIKEVLDNIINNYENSIYIFIIYLKSSNKDDYLNMNEEINKIYSNKNLKFIPVLHKENSKQFNLDDIIKKTINSFKNYIYSIKTDCLNDIIKYIQKNVAKIETKKNGDDLYNSICDIFEKLLGKLDGKSKEYLQKNIKNVLKYSKDGIYNDEIKDSIDKFKKEKLKFKNIKKCDFIEKIDDNLNKELEEKYAKISTVYYKENFNDEIFLYYCNLIKKEVVSNIIKSINDLKKSGELKSLIEKEIENNNNFKNLFK